MPYQNDTATLADIVGPAYAAQQAGIQNDVENQKEQMANQVYQAQMPALEQQPGLENLFKQAQTGYQQGLGMSAQAHGLQDLAAAPSGAQAMISGNQLKLSQDQAQKLNTIGTMTGQLAGVLDSVPPAARPAYMQQFLADKGITDPTIVQAVGSGDPDTLRGISQKMIQAGSDYQTKMGITEMQGQNAAQVAQIGSEGRVQAATLQAQARMQVQQLKNTVDSQKQTTDQFIASMLKVAATRPLSTAEQAALQNAQQTEQSLRNSQQQLTAQMLGMGMPQMPTLPQQQSGGSQQQQQQSPQGVDAVQALARQMDPNYDPNKYDYRIDPNGNLQRKPK